MPDAADEEALARRKKKIHRVRDVGRRCVAAEPDARNGVERDPGAARRDARRPRTFRVLRLLLTEDRGSFDVFHAWRSAAERCSTVIRPY
jgi:hypothetical protein